MTDSPWVKYSSLHREAIIHRVLIGEITPGEAEIEAAALELGPLEESPDPSLFDPREEVWWSLPMVAAWIMYRDFDRVRRAWPLYSELVRVWKGPKICESPPPHPGEKISGYVFPRPDTALDQGSPRLPGYELAKLPDIPLIVVLMQLWEDKNSLGTLDSQQGIALVPLWKCLQNGQLLAEGIPYGGGVRVPIRESEWIDLDAMHSFKWPVDAIGNQDEKFPRYVSVKVPSNKVLSIWPSKGDFANAEPKVRAIMRHDTHLAIRGAVADLWPKGSPIGLTVKQRDSLIIDWFKKKGLKSPGYRTISRALKSEVKI